MQVAAAIETFQALGHISRLDSLLLVGCDVGLPTVVISHSFAKKANEWGTRPAAHRRSRTYWLGLMTLVWPVVFSLKTSPGIF